MSPAQTSPKLSRRPRLFSSFRLSFCASILAHAAALGLIVFAGFGPAKLVRPPELPLIALSIIPAPEDILEAEEAGAPMVPSPTIAQTSSTVSEAPSSPAAPPIAEPVGQAQPPDIESREADTPPPAPVPAGSDVLPQTTSAPATTSAEATVASGAGGGSDAGEGPNGVPPQSGGRVDPAYVNTPEPAYPLVAQRRRQEGRVLLKVRVTDQGQAARVKLARSSGFPLLDEAAMAAVRRWEFAPARIGSQSVAADIEVPVDFALRP